MSDANTNPDPVATPRQRGAGTFGAIFVWGNFVGAFLVLLGFVSLFGALIDFTVSALILCSGLALIFGAFGSTATIRYKGIVVTGVAAVALVILYMLVYLISDNYVLVKIGGDVHFGENGNQMARISAWADTDFTASSFGITMSSSFEGVI